MKYEDRIIGYYKAVYELTDAGISLRIGHRHPAWDEELNIRGVECYHIVTPCNPGSTKLSVHENLERIQRLDQILGDLGCGPVLEGRNLDPENRWPPEPSRIILELSLKQGFTLASEFGQSALVYGERGLVPMLVWTHSPLG